MYPEPVTSCSDLIQSPQGPDAQKVTLNAVECGPYAEVLIKDIWEIGYATEQGPLQRELAES